MVEGYFICYDSKNKQTNKWRKETKKQKRKKEEGIKKLQVQKWTNSNMPGEQ